MPSPQGSAAGSRLVKNSFFGIFAWFFPLLVGFIATPILVRGLGNENYGILALITGFISYSFTFGIGKVVAKFIPEFRASGESGKIGEVISATFWFSLSIGIAGFSLLALFARTVVIDFLRISSESQAVALTALYIAAFIGLATLISQIFQYALQGLHRFDIYVILTNLYGFLLGAGNIALVYFGYGVIALLWWNLIVMVSVGVMFFIGAYRLLPEFSIRFKVNGDIRSAVLRYGGNIIITQVFANILYTFERSWVTRKFGPEVLTFYTVPMLLGIYLHSLIASFVQVLFPVVNELLRQRENMISLYQRATKIIVAVVFFVVSTYIVSGKMLLTYWLNAGLAEQSYYLLVIHGLSFGFIALLIISLQVAEANRFSSLGAIVSGLWMLIAVPAMILTADRWGSLGVGISRLSAAVVTMPVIFLVERKFLGKVFVAFWLSTIARVAVAMAAGVAAQVLITYELPASRISFVVAVGISGAIFVLVLLAAGYLNASDREMLKRLFRRGDAGVTEGGVA